MTKKESLTTKNGIELTTMLAHAREELRMLRFASAGSRPQDSAAPKKTRRQIARILTEMHAQKMSAAAMKATATAE